MGIMWQGGKLGVAYYDVDTTQVSLMLDVVETEAFTFLKRSEQYILYIGIFSRQGNLSKNEPRKVC